MAHVKDLTGQSFGRLTVVGFSRMKAQGSYWSCRCTCGVPCEVRGSSLSSGVTRSCGCFSRDSTGERNRTHGGTGTAAHRSWAHMRARCRDAKNEKYEYYGGRGISVCPEWDDYAVFAADMGEPPEGYTLDRIDPNGDYTPSNCRWASRLVQSRNQRMRYTNTSGHRGVFRNAKSNKWYAQIRANGLRAGSKHYDTIEEAVEARKELERLHWGEET